MAAINWARSGDDFAYVFCFLVRDSSMELLKTDGINLQLVRFEREVSYTGRWTPVASAVLSIPAAKLAGKPLLLSTSSTLFAL